MDTIVFEVIYTCKTPKERDDFLYTASESGADRGIGFWPDLEVRAWFTDQDKAWAFTKTLERAFLTEIFVKTHDQDSLSG